MPRSTIRFPFESKMISALMAFGERLTGSAEQGHGFLIELDDAGQVLRIVTEQADPRFATRERTDVMIAYLLYDPFEEPEYVYAGWQNVSRATVKRLLGVTFEYENFNPLHGELMDLHDFPETHGVML